MISTAEDLQDRAAHKGTCRNTDRTTERAVREESDKHPRWPADLPIPAEEADLPIPAEEADLPIPSEEADLPIPSEEADLPIPAEEADLPIPAEEADLPRSGLSEALHHHLPQEEFSKGHGSHWGSRPEIASADSPDEALVTNIILLYVKSSRPKEPTPELTVQLSPQGAEGGASGPSGSPTTTAENAPEGSAPEGGEPVADGSPLESSTLLARAKSPSSQQKGCQGQTLQKLQMENTRSGLGFQYDHVPYGLSDLVSVAPLVKIPKDNRIDKPPPTDRPAGFSPELRARLALGQEVSAGASWSSCAENEEQQRTTVGPSRQPEMEPAIHVHQGHLTGTESETSPLKLPPTSLKDPSSSSYIFQKISQGRMMCQKLKEQTDQLKTKVQEFSRSIAQDSPCREQDERQELEKLQAHLERREQGFGANEEKRLTSEQRVHQRESPAARDLDPERKAEIFKLELLLEGVKGKLDEGRHTSAGSLPLSSPTIAGELPSTSPPPSDEEDPHPASGGQGPAETTRRSCAFCHRILGWKQAMEKKGPRRTDCGRLPTALREKALHAESHLSPNTGLSCSSASSTGLQSNTRETCGTGTPRGRPQSNTCETCGMETPSPPRGCPKEPPKEFHYRYNTLGQNDFNHSKGRAFVQLCFLNENTNSVPSCSKPNWICSQRAHSKSSQDEPEPKPGKENRKAPMSSSSDLATSSPHFHSHRISGSSSLSHVSSVEETKSKGLHSPLDHALRTATVLKETTDQMIRTIAEDLAKLQTWRNRLKY